ncbi:MAG: glycosyltransferase family 2 protein [Candidatus Binataceae bacterium]|nr:glycosyltransferase family 2 protein [Candidatus Binataceae bacterium]
MTFRCCAIIPSHNHSAVIGEIVRQLRSDGLAVFIIDDGSDDVHRTVLEAIHSPDGGVTVYRFAVNRGKGAAVIKGVELAIAAGFTHALQIDADGQHDLAQAPAMIAISEAHPEALIAGAPLYDESMPRARRVGRRITHFWVAIETLSIHPADTMCGFRLYPLDRLNAVLKSARVGQRMDFDPEIMVRLIWSGMPVFFVPVRVAYPVGNLSGFALIGDNWRITKMHTRLVFALPWRLRQILRNRRRPAASQDHWAALGERGAYLGLRILALFYRLIGRYGCMAAVFPIAAYFHLTSREQRRSSQLFLRRAYQAQGLAREPGWIDTLRHSLGFARKTVDTFAAWMGDIDPAIVKATDHRTLNNVMADGQGILLMVSHLGNIEISRALLDQAQRSRIKLLVHTLHAQKFARILQQFRPEAAVDTIQVTEVNPGTMIALKEIIEAGGWVAIAGDRTPVTAHERVCRAPFLGHDASFPEGPYLLAHLLECPVYLMFCLRHKGGYRLYFEKFADRITLPRRDKSAAVAQWAARYARRLERYCLIDPLQWYNFFDFWSTTPANAKAGAQ